MRNLKPLMIVAIVALTVFCLPASAAAAPDKKPKEKIEYRDKKQMSKRHPHAMRDKDFKMMVGIVEDASFDNKKIDVIRVACIGSYFSSRQCAQLLSLLSFDNNKMKALEVIAPRLVDMENADKIIKEFSFSSSKDKAVSILKRRNR